MVLGDRGRGQHGEWRRERGCGIVRDGRPSKQLRLEWLELGVSHEFSTELVSVHGESGLDIEYGARRVDGGGTSWIFIGNGIAGQAIATSTGAFLSTGGVWTNNSDRDSKTAVQPIDARSVLDEVSRLPISSWQYIADRGTVRHIGPMAQDFHAAFGRGPSDGRSIATVDADGVALAAIQALNAIVREQQAELRSPKAELSRVTKAAGAALSNENSKR